MGIDFDPEDCSLHLEIYFRPALQRLKLALFLIYAFWHETPSQTHSPHRREILHPQGIAPPDSGSLPRAPTLLDVLRVRWKGDI